MARKPKSETGKKLGYARVSTADQSLKPQVDALNKFGCDHVFEEKASGARLSRKALQLALNSLHPGDTFVVWKLDRLARSLKGLIEVIEFLDKWDVRFISLTDNIDAGSASGKFLLHMIGAVAEFERNIISERTKLGLAARKEAGLKFGPAHSIAGNKKRLRRFIELRDTGELDGMTARQIIEAMNKADRSAPPITSPQTYRNWKYGGFKGVPRPQDDRPMKLKDRDD